MTTMPTTSDDRRWSTTPGAWRGLIAGLALVIGAGVASGQAVEVGGEQVYVRRTSDSVVVRFAADGSQRTLYSHDGARVLGVGDEVEQGSSGRTDWVLPGGGVVSMSSAGHGIIERLGGKRDWLNFPYVTYLTATSQSRPLGIALGPNLRASFEGTTIKVTRDAGVYTIRNEGGTPVQIAGDLVHKRDATADVSARPDPRIAPSDPIGIVTLGVAEEIRVVPRSTIERGKEVELWGDLPVRHGGAVELVPEGDALVLRGTDQEEPSRVSVGGVTLIATPNDALVVRRLRPRPAGHEAPPSGGVQDNPENEP